MTTATAVQTYPEVTQARERLDGLRAREQRLRAAIRDSLAGRELTVEELAALVFEGADWPEGRPSVADLQAEHEAVRLAIQRATTAAGSAKNEATEAVIAELQPRYAAEVRRLAGCVRDLLKEAEAEQAIRQEAAKAGVNPILHPKSFHPLPEGALRAWLEVAETRYGA